MDNIKDRLEKMSEAEWDELDLFDALLLLREAKDLIQDYEEANEDKKRLVRELDVALHGEEGAAKQASLCDIVAIIKSKELKVIRRDDYEMLHRQIHNLKRYIEDYGLAEEPKAFYIKGTGAFYLKREHITARDLALGVTNLYERKTK